MIEGGINDRWFKLSEKIRTLYQDREAPQVHDELIELCLRQIAMSKSMIHEFQTNSEQNKESIERWKGIKENFDELIRTDNGDGAINIEFIKTKSLEAENMLKELENPVSRTSIRLPISLGYDKLFQIYMTDCAYQEAIELAECAKSEGWSGDWDKRIAKANRELSK
jgi:hypothetical protein